MKYASALPDVTEYRRRATSYCSASVTMRYALRQHQKISSALVDLNAQLAAKRVEPGCVRWKHEDFLEAYNAKLAIVSRIEAQQGELQPSFASAIEVAAASRPVPKAMQLAKLAMLCNGDGSELSVAFPERRDMVFAVAAAQVGVEHARQQRTKAHERWVACEDSAIKPLRGSKDLVQVCRKLEKQIGKRRQVWAMCQAQLVDTLNPYAAVLNTEVHASILTAEHRRIDDALLSLMDRLRTVLQHISSSNREIQQAQTFLKSAGEHKTRLE